MNQKKVLKILKELYPQVRSELNFTNTYQLLVSVMLSAQCTDKKVNEVTPALFKKYPDFKTLSRAKISVVEEIIRQVNYYKTKSRHLINTANKICQDFNSEVPQSMENLIKLAGVGRKTASVILSECGAEPALPVDTHIFRVSRRLGLSKGRNVLSVEEDLRKLFPKEEWRGLHHRLIFHGRRICSARKPLCEECQLNNCCEFYKQRE